nr:immunoglobulin heavy chain junction region [Mus musculus]
CARWEGYGYDETWFAYW